MLEQSMLSHIEEGQKKKQEKQNTIEKQDIEESITDGDEWHQKKMEAEVCNHNPNWEENVLLIHEIIKHMYAEWCIPLFFWLGITHSTIRAYRDRKSSPDTTWEGQNASVHTKEWNESWSKFFLQRFSRFWL